MTAPWAEIWPQWICEKRIGQGSCGTVYQAVCGEGENAQHAAVKVIHIPQNEAETEALFAEGMTEEESREYYGAVVENLLSEVILSSGLQDHKNIVRVEDYAVEPRADGLGATIFIRMELLTPLNVYLSDKTLSEADVMRLGTDICRALKVCHTAGILHRDVKPENIFIDQEGNFKLGDFGIARRLEHASTYLTRVGTPFYAAPEVALSAKYDGRADIYSLGLVLYRLLNHNRLPFMEGKRLLTPADRSLAMERRRSGESLPPPAEASERATAVIRKACAFKAEDRYQSADEFYEALAGEEKKKAAPFWRSKGIVAAALAVIALGIAGFGWSRGWFTRVQRPETEPAEITSEPSFDTEILPASASSSFTEAAVIIAPAEQTTTAPASDASQATSSRAARVPRTAVTDLFETTSEPGPETVAPPDETEAATEPPAVTEVPTTAPDPTTAAIIPTTAAPTTAVPTTKATTVAPVTTAPATAAPTTVAPTTEHVHEWGSWEIVYEYGDSEGDPCNSGGYKYRVCSSCDAEERQEMPAPGHQMEWVIRKEPTCLEPGLKIQVCSRCHQEGAEEEIPAPGHSFSGGVCTTCGKDLFLWQTNYEGTACSVTGFNWNVILEGSEISEEAWQRSVRSIEIPSYHNGLPVTEVNLNAWNDDRWKCTDVTLPGTARSASVSMSAISGTLTVPGSVEELVLGQRGGKVVLNEGLKRLDAYSCELGGTLNVPDSVEFFNFNGIINGDLILGTNVWYAYSRNFFWTGQLTVKSGNPNFRAKGNCLIAKGEKAIVATGTDYTIPSDGSAKKIWHVYTRNDGTWEDLVFPEGIEEIEESCFNNEFLVLQLPRSLKAFSNLMNESAQYYRFAGTKEELNAIPLEIADEVSADFVVICSDGRMKVERVDGAWHEYKYVFKPID